MSPPLMELLSTLLYSLKISVCRTLRSSGGSPLIKPAVAPTMIAVGIQSLRSPSFVGKSQMSFSSCKNLAGILRQETSRSTGFGAAFVLERDFGVLLADCVCAGADETSCAGNDEISCAWLATAENVNNMTRNEAATKRG